MERRVISLSAQLKLQPPGPQRALSLLVFRVSLEFRVRKSLCPGIWGFVVLRACGALNSLLVFGPEDFAAPYTLDWPFKALNNLQRV